MSKPDKEQTIKCPSCGLISSYMDMAPHYMWSIGEHQEIRFDCPQCETTLLSCTAQMTAVPGKDPVLVLEKSKREEDELEQSFRHGYCQGAFESIEQVNALLQDNQDKQVKFLNRWVMEEAIHKIAVREGVLEDVEDHADCKSAG